MKEWAREILLDALTADRPPTLLHLDAMIAANEAFSHHPYIILPAQLRRRLAEVHGAAFHCGYIA